MHTCTLNLESRFANMGSLKQASLLGGAGGAGGATGGSDTSSGLGATVGGGLDGGKQNLSPNNI